MLTLFKRAMAVLTTLFVFAMPLQAAYGDGLTNNVPSAGDCTTFEMIVSADAKAKLEAAGTKFVDLTTDQHNRAKAAVEKVAGPAPWPVEKSKLVASAPGGNFLFYFTAAGCYLGATIISNAALPDIMEAIEGKSL